MTPGRWVLVGAALGALAVATPVALYINSVMRSWDRAWGYA